MKILHASDLHFDKAKFDQIFSLEFDICCISGDLIDTNQKDIVGQKAWVKQWLENFKKPIFVCSGNHDVSERLIFMRMAILRRLRVLNLAAPLISARIFWILQSATCYLRIFRPHIRKRPQSAAEILAIKNFFEC